MYGLKMDWELEPRTRHFVLEDYQGATPRWCSGCGDNSVLGAVERLARDLQLAPEKTVVVSGIGCSSRFPHYMSTYGFHGLHGRPLPIASGVRSRRPDLNVFVVTGDGDCCAIGTSHWIRHPLQHAHGGAPARQQHLRAHEDAELADDAARAQIQHPPAGRLAAADGDATRCDLPHFEMVVSNLPYSASSKITFRLLHIGFKEAVLMYQSEFADRMVAPAGTKDCGRLSIMVQTYATVQLCFKLPTNCFAPKPQVHSTVVKIVPREQPIFPINDQKRYSDVVRALFSHRRKTVRNCLRGSAGMLDPEWVHRVIAALPEEILKSRPEELYLEDFATISNMA